MKTIGLLGGMSWESTALYYQWINSYTKQHLGKLHSAKIAMVSVDFQEIETLQQKGQWQEAGVILTRAAQQIEAAGADFLLICTNTMHIVAPQIQAGINIPLLHLADATAQRIVSKKIKTVGLLGTGFTMEQEFYKGRLSDNYGLEVIVPEKHDRDIIHQTIYDELCHGKITDTSREEYLTIMQKMADQGCEAIIEGCTEITLLVKQKHTNIPLFDTTGIHAEEAVKMALNIQ